MGEVREVKEVREVNEVRANSLFTKYLPTKNNPLPSLKCPQRGGEGKALFTSQDVLRIRKQQAGRHQYRSLLHSSGLPPVQE